METKINKLHNYQSMNVDIFFSGMCNMNCSYCYIPKGNHLNEINKKIRQSLTDGSMINDFLKVFDPEVVRHVGLWGAEPTINFDLAEPFLNDFFTTFENVDTVMFSTNLLMGHKPVIEILEAVNKTALLVKGKKISKLNVQLSLDGPDWITDVNRHPNATKSLVNSFKELINWLTVNKLDNVKLLRISFKPTLSPENMREMNEDYSKMIGWFKFFVELNNYYMQFNEQLKERTEILCCPSPTLISPGQYTSEDGKNFAQWLRNIYSIDCKKENLQPYRQPLFTQSLQLFGGRYLDHAKDLAIHFSEFHCSAANTSFSVGYQNDLHPCHRSFVTNTFTKITSDKEKLLAQNFIGDLNNPTDVNRLSYLARSHTDFQHKKIAFITAAVKRMAMCGQVSKIYLNNDNLCHTLAIFVLGQMCFLDAAHDTFSFSVPTLSMVRLFANGALEILYEIALRERGIIH